MQKILASACLLGQPLRYDGRDYASGSDLNSDILASWQDEGRIVSICPEVVGGLAVPRPPAEIQGGDGGAVLDGTTAVMTAAGDDVSDNFMAGAKQALALCQQHGIAIAILVESSPSCGSHQIRDGSFSGAKVAGMGVTTALLRQHGISVFNQFQLAEVAALINREKQ